MNILFINCLCSLEIKDIIPDMIVILGMNIGYFFNCLYKFVTEHTFKTIEIGVSIGALIYAIRAFNQSLKARRYSSFETIFSQMLSLQRSFFDNQYMFSKEHRPLTDKFVFNLLYKILDNNGNSTDRKLKPIEDITEALKPLEDKLEYYKRLEKKSKDNIFKLKGIIKPIEDITEALKPLEDKLEYYKRLEKKSKDNIFKLKGIIILRLIGIIKFIIKLKPLEDITKALEPLETKLEYYKKLVKKSKDNIFKLKGIIILRLIGIIKFIIKKSKNDVEINNSSILETDYLSNYYKEFVKGINNVEHFKNCFKFIYNIVTLVEKSKIDKNDKKLYIDRIQALLNRNEIFCYFVNLVEHGNKLQGKKLVEHERNIKDLKKYEFFKDLDDKDGCFHALLSKIDSKLLDQFGI